MEGEVPVIRAVCSGGERAESGVWSCRIALALAVGLLCAALATESAAAQRGRAEVQEGNRLYREGRYGEAHEKYLDALRDAPDSPLIRFNDGNALYRSDDFQRALEAYREAIEAGDPQLLSEAWYNLGNALYRQQQLQEALEAYKQSLRIDPDDIDTKHNLERVLQQMQEQEQQQQGQGDSSEQDQEQRDQEPGDQQGSEQQQQQEQQQEGQGQHQEQGRRERESSEGDDERQHQEPEPQPGQMTREEAERLLRAIQEDPDKIQRQRMPDAARRRPRKDW